MEAATANRKPALSERSRAERRLGWMLCAPAVIAMLAVTAYPIIYAIVLSLQKVDLRVPDESGFVGLDNYTSVLTSDLWWTDVFNTLFITVVSVSIELVLGMAIALIMHRAIFGRGVSSDLLARTVRISTSRTDVRYCSSLPRSSFPSLPPRASASS